MPKIVFFCHAGKILSIPFLMMLYVGRLDTLRSLSDFIGILVLGIHVRRSNLHRRTSRLGFP